MGIKKVFKKTAFFLLVILGIFIFAAPNEVYAQIIKSSQITTSIRPKTLALTAPALISINPIDVSVSEAETAGMISNIEITDLRGKKTPLGWSLTVTATDFKSPENGIIPVSKLRMEVNSYRFINGTDGGITIPGKIPFTDGNSDGVSDAITLLIAQPGFGAGKFGISPILKLLIPPFTVAGNYQSTVTLTLS